MKKPANHITDTAQPNPHIKLRIDTQKSEMVVADPYKAMNSLAISAAIQRAVEVASTYQKALNSFASSETMQRAVEVASTYQKAMNSLASSEAIQRAVEVASTYQKGMNSLASSEAMQRAMGITASYQQPIAEILNRSSFKRVIATFSESEKLLAALDSIGRIDKSIPADALQEMELANETIEYQLQEVGNAGDLDSFVQAFSKLSPTIKAILFFCILQLLAITQNIVANIVTPHIEELISNSEISERGLVKKIQTLNFENVDIANLRFVTTEHLLLRESPSTRSLVLDELQFGQVVTMIRKQRNWMEVSYAYENGEIMHGWVFSRYTAKFKNYVK